MVQVYVPVVCLIWIYSKYCVCVKKFFKYVFALKLSSCSVINENIYEKM